MKILIASDAWQPQVNGVVRTLMTTRDYLRKMGHEVQVISPDLFSTIPCPTYPEIRLAYKLGKKIQTIIEDFQPDAVHIATEGPLGWATRRYCIKHGYRFTTSFHTKFPEYAEARFRIPASWGYALLRRFHARAERIMVATQSMAKELEQWGFQHLARWSRGVDTKLFKLRDKNFLSAPRPIALYVGRVAVEKSIEDFLKLKFDGSKFVVGDGPQLHELQEHYPDVQFVGMKTGEELAQYYASADIFIFPSRTDTFGLVLIEALASGVPVAAYPVPGPLDVIDHTGIGVLHEDLQTAVDQVLANPPSPQKCREYAMRYAWEVCTQQFLNNLCVPAKK